MKDWHALWLPWTPRPGDGFPLYGNPPSLLEGWIAAGQQWWSWWLAAVTSPWLRQPWPHAGQLEAPVPLPGQDGADPPASVRHRASPSTRAAHAPEPRKPPAQRPSPHKSRQLQRRKINPGG